MPFFQGGGGKGTFANVKPQAKPAPLMAGLGRALANIGGAVSQATDAVATHPVSNPAPVHANMAAPRTDAQTSGPGYGSARASAFQASSSRQAQQQAAPLGVQSSRQALLSALNRNGSSAWDTSGARTDAQTSGVGYGSGKADAFNLANVLSGKGSDLNTKSAEALLRGSSPSLLTNLPAFATGSKASGDVSPLGKAWTIGRTDMGVDANAPVGTPIVAPNDSKVVGISPNWYAGQPYEELQLLKGPNKGKDYYVAEQITNLPQTGQVIPRGKPVAQYAPSGTGIEVGWGSGTPGRTLAAATTGYSEGQVTPAGQSFLNEIQHPGSSKPGPSVAARVQPGARGVLASLGSRARVAADRQQVALKAQARQPMDSPTPSGQGQGQLQGVPSKLGQLFVQAGKQNKIPPEVLAGIAQVESSMGTNRSNSGVGANGGAKGLMQFEDATAAQFHNNPATNDQAAVFDAAKLLNQYGYQQNPARAIAAYNAGPGNVGAGAGYAQQVLANAAKFRGNVGSISTPAVSGSGGSGSGSAVVSSGGGGTASPVQASVSGATPATAQTVGQTPAPTSQQTQQQQLLSGFLSQQGSSSNPWNAGPQLSTGPSALGNLINFSGGSSLLSAAESGLQSLAGSTKLVSSRRKGS